MITADDIKANKPLVVKWAKPLVDGTTGEVTEGVMRGNANEFMTRIEDESELLSRFRYVEMNGETQDLQVLRVRARFQNMNKLTGAKKGAQIESLSEVTETVPDIVKEKLTAQPFTAFTVIPKTWLHTNIEKQGFISKYESLLVPSCKFSAEQISVFGKKTEADADGIHALDGLLTQLDTINEAYETEVDTNPKFPMGKYTSIDASGDKKILPQINAMLRQFSKQKGKRKNATIFVSSELESLIIEEASGRETPEGDKLYFNDVGNATYHGREIVALDVLDNPENGYGDVVIIMDPNSVGYGPVLDMDSEGEYSVWNKGYVTSVDSMFDVGIIFPEDVLYADVDYTPSN